eukprot:9499411-Pyramimonas_sp.AAC.1
MQFRDWCEFCVRGRSKESPYKHGEDSPYPVVQLDYFFVKTAEDANVITCISIIIVSPGYGACTQVKNKGSSDTHAIDFIIKHLEHAGFTNTIVVQTDDETSIKDVARVVASKRKSNTQLRHTPAGHKKAN